jgi:hypothetical protein
MAANYEALGEQEFQRLCQALLLAPYPDLQCMPVAMPDGGRDATVDHPIEGTIVFQVKFARAPERLDDVVGWVCASIDRERPKVEELVRRGARRYVLMTNVRGSSHLGTGSIDRVQDHLNSTLPIPAQCLWRDDLDRRLDGQPQLKLRYPALLDGVDAVRMVWESGFAGEQARRRRRALEAYLAHQHGEDSGVRFRQTGQERDDQLLDIFVDVPVVPPRRRVDSLLADWYHSAAAANGVPRPFDDARPRHLGGGMTPELGAEAYFGPDALGAASLLLGQHARAFPLLVVEGAPGQGKSTLSQYLAQVHRIRLLGKGDEAARMPPAHRASPLLIPFKLDLRDLAAWLDPEERDSPEPRRPSDWEPTLESALAAHVHRFSGGMRFDVADLDTVIRDNPTIVILDGLDEVGNPAARERVVAAIAEAVTRLGGRLSDFRVLVTSRPSVIAHAAALPRRQFQYLALGPLSYPLVDEYAEKWAAARQLSARDLAEQRSVLREKLNQPHMVELAKNTMQLSILLSLIWAIGASLPDKRTELYNEYFKVFLNREAQKSLVVREHRDTLIDIHRYLAFHLHSAAESNQNSVRGAAAGRITEDELRALLRDYLREKGKPAELVDGIFTGMIERVVAIVSRVTGTYEFEVQSLREFFAGRFLNDTAPNSPAGRPKPGTKPDRFLAVAPNPHWFNTCRFFAGCFNKGELADLAERVEELGREAGQAAAPLARTVAVALLQDWVFTQSPKATARMVDFAFDDLGLRWASLPAPILAEAGGGRIRLTGECGGGQLFGKAWERLQNEPLTERARGLCQLAAASGDFRTPWLHKVRRETGSARTRWIAFGAWADVVRHLATADALDLLGPEQDKEFSARACHLVGAGLPYDDLPAATRSAVVRAVLNFGGLSLVNTGANQLMTIANLANIVPASGIFRSETDRKADDESVGATVAAISELMESSVGESWYHSLERWRWLVDAVDRLCPDTWLARRLAFRAASEVRSRAESGRGSTGLFSGPGGLVDRLRAARRRRNQAWWWEGQLEEAQSQFDRALWVLAVTEWCSADALRSLILLLDRVVTGLDGWVAGLLQEAVRDRARRAPGRRIEHGFSPGAHQRLAADTAMLLHFRAGAAEAELLVRRAIAAGRWTPFVATSIADFIEPRLGEVPKNWMSDLIALEDLELSGALRGGETLWPKASPAELPAEIADKILRNPWGFSSTAVILASAVAPAPRIVAEIAQEQQWLTELWTDDR